MKLLELGIAELAMRLDMSEYLSEMETVNKILADVIKNKDVSGMVEKNYGFHMIFANSSENEYLVRAMHKVRCESSRFAFLSFSHKIRGTDASLDKHYHSVIQQHKDIIRLLSDRKEKELKEMICEHITSFKMRIVNYLTS